MDSFAHYVLKEDTERPTRTHPEWRSHCLLLGVAFTAFAAGAACTSGFSQSAVALKQTDVMASKDEQDGVLVRHCDSQTTKIKHTVCSMDHSLVGLGDTWRDWTSFLNAMIPYWDEQFVYTPMYGINESVGLRSWFHNEMETWSAAFPWVEFNQMIFIGSGPNASTTTYAVGDWTEALGPLLPTHKRTIVRICDFYIAGSDERIAHNYMMIDMLDLLRQQGVVPLPLSPLIQGRVSPPQGDGMPAPLLRYIQQDEADEARRVVSAMMDAEWVGTSTALQHWQRDDMVWYGPVPFGMATTGAQYVEHFLKPFHAAFATERALRIDSFACEGQYCAAHATFTGRHTGRWLGNAPSGRLLSLDAGMHWRVIRGRIVEAWAIFDLPKMLLPLGVDLLGAPQLAQSKLNAPSGGGSPSNPEGGHGSISADAVSHSAKLVDNECSNEYTIPPGGAEEPADGFDCPAFVIRSTDETWHPRNWERTNAAVDTYFSSDWQSVRAFGMMLHGREELRAFMRDWLGGFPNVFIHVADVFCLGNARAGYKTTMPYVLTATHSGWSKAFGAPTGRKVKYHGIANCYIKLIDGQWQYTREWDLPDMAAFLAALNMTTAQIVGAPSGDLVPVDTCKPLFEWTSGEMNWFPNPDKAA